jgi:hypothetical protein
MSLFIGKNNVFEFQSEKCVGVFEFPKEAVRFAQGTILIAEEYHQFIALGSVNVVHIKSVIQFHNDTIAYLSPLSKTFFKNLLGTVALRRLPSMALSPVPFLLRRKGTGERAYCAVLRIAS